MKKSLLSLGLIITLTFLLQGCFVVMGGAAVGAASTAILYDNRDFHTMLNDETISRQIATAINSHEAIRSQCHIVISTYHGIVLLAGQAPTTALKTQIQILAKQQPHIKRLYNEIQIEGPTTMLTRSSDTWITTKTKTALLNTPKLKSGNLKVITENGTVYLMGILTREQAKLAVQTTRTIGGVQKVVTVFQYQK